MQLIPFPDVPATTLEGLSKVYELEAKAGELPQLDLPIKHTFHAGMYTRTITVPAGVFITGALIKIPTMLIVNGDCLIYTGAEAKRLTGYHVMTAAAGRKQAFVAISDTQITMAFATDAVTVEDAEREFTDEVDKLKHGD